MWLEIDEQTLVTAIQSQTFLIGPYLLIAVGCGIVLVSVIGIIGAACSKSCNRVLLILVRVIISIQFWTTVSLFSYSFVVHHFSVYNLPCRNCWRNSSIHF